MELSGVAQETQQVGRLLRRHVAEQQLGHQGLGLCHRTLDVSGRDPVFLALPVAQTHFVLAVARQNTREDPAVGRFQQVRSELRLDPTRRLQQVNQQLLLGVFRADIAASSSPGRRRRCCRIVATRGRRRAGRKVFLQDGAALCKSRHRFGREGRDVGPELKHVALFAPWSHIKCFSLLCILLVAIAVSGLRRSPGWRGSCPAWRAAPWRFVASCGFMAIASVAIAQRPPRTRSQAD